MRQLRQVLRFAPVLLAALAALPLAPLLAQSSVRLESRGATAAIVNELPVRIVGFVRDLRDLRGGSGRVVVVDSGAAASIAAPAGSILLERFEVISPAVALRQGWSPPCVKFDAAATQAAVATLQRELDALPLERRRAGLEALQIAASVAALRHQQARDSLRLANHDPVDAWMRVEALNNMSARQQRQYESQRVSTAAMQTLDAIGRSAEIYAEQEEAKYKVLEQDAARYKELMEQTTASLAELRTRVAAVDRDVWRQAEFQRTAIAEVERVAARPASVAVAPASGLRRSCEGAANVSDVAEFSASLDEGVAVLAGEMYFDRGAPQAVLVRREMGSPRWIAQFNWPTEASAARLRVRPLGSVRWTDVPAEVQTGRTPLASIVATLERQAETARRKYRESSQRAKGSDHVKTLIVPE